MSAEKPLILYDLVPVKGGPYFSPVATRARLALLSKGVPFEVRDVTLGDLRRTWSGLNGPFGVEKATGQLR